MPLLTQENKTELKEKGYTVVKNVVTKEDAQRYLNSLTSIIEKLGSSLYVLHSGMIQYIAHDWAQWDIRRVTADIYRELYETSDVVTSMGGFCYMDGDRRNQRVPIDAFLHRDQNLLMKDHLYYQGFLSLTDNERVEEGGFVCCEGTNKIVDWEEYVKRPEYQTHVRKKKENWWPFNDEEKEALKKNGYIPKFIPCSAGDFLLWDSRTVHCNTKCYEKGKKRVVVYVCMRERATATKKDMEKRRKAYQLKRCTRHLATFGFNTFPKVPRLFGNKEKEARILKVIDEIHHNLSEDERCLL